VQKPCLDCDAIVDFPEPGDATCPNCDLGMYLTESGQVGRYRGPDWDPGRIQGWTRRSDRQHPSSPQF
jgi:hypothetical protein